MPKPKPAHTAADIARHACVVFVDNLSKPFNIRLLDVGGGGKSLVVHIELPRGVDESPEAQAARTQAAVEFAGHYLAPDIRVVHTA